MTSFNRGDVVVNVLGIAGVDNSKVERRISAFPPKKCQKLNPY